MKNIITHPTIEEKKSKAIEVLKLLDIYKPYIVETISSSIMSDIKY